jgi:hypothetical protein
MGKMRELHTTHFTIHKIQSGKKLVWCLCVGGSETPKNRGRNRRDGKKAKKKKETKKKECFRHTHTHTHVCDDDQQSCCCLREGGWFRQRNATKPQNLMTENSCSLFYFLALAIRRFPLFLIGLV